jgi:hypothetical protein
LTHNKVQFHREGSKKKICDINPLLVVVKKGYKWGNLKESLTELNVSGKQRNFLLAGGIINYVGNGYFSGKSEK